MTKKLIKWAKIQVSPSHPCHPCQSGAMPPLDLGDQWEVLGEQRDVLDESYRFMLVFKFMRMHYYEHLTCLQVVNRSLWTWTVPDLVGCCWYTQVRSGLRLWKSGKHFNLQPAIRNIFSSLARAVNVHTSVLKMTAGIHLSAGHVLCDSIVASIRWCL